MNQLAPEKLSEFRQMNKEEKQSAIDDFLEKYKAKHSQDAKKTETEDANGTEQKEDNEIFETSVPFSLEFSSLDADHQRETLAVVKAEIPEFSFGQFIGNEEFVIGVQSKFLNEDAEANDKPIILQFAGNVKAGTVAEYGDTGVGQKAAIKKGVASLQEVEVPSPCRLMPYRTFTEVAQPMSNFIFRVKDNDRYGVTCALFEADGGAWKNEAKANIKAYLEKELADVSNIFVIS